MAEWTREMLAKRTEEQVAEIADRVLNRVAKWRNTLAGWQLGTRLDTDGEFLAVRDQREGQMMLRIEVSALTALLIEKGVFTPREFTEQMIVEAEDFEAKLERKFPGFKATDMGMSIDIAKARETMEGWPP
jgi:hypothetical protein